MMSLFEHDRVRTFAELVPAMVSYVDRDLRYRYNNAEYARFMGRPVSESTGQLVRDVLGPSFTVAEPGLRQALGGEVAGYVQRVTMGTNSGHFQVRMIPDQPGEEVQGVYVFVTDVTEQVDSQQLAAERVRELRLVFDAAPFGIALTGPAGDIVDANRAFQRISGYDHAELSTRTIFEMLHPDDLPRIARDATRLMTGEIESFHAESRAIHADGSVVWVAGGLSAERGEDGQVEHLVAGVSDVSERHQLERTMQAQFSEQQRHLGRELHDSVGQPLTAVAMLAKSLRSRLESQALPEAATAETLVQLTAAAHAKVAALIRGVRPVDVDREGLRAALDELAMSTQHLHDVWCTVECVESVEVANNDTATQLFRIAQEAVANAVKHGKARRIVLWLGHIDRRVVLRIHDDGVGLSGSESGTGTGLGMRIMDHRATAVGATLAVEEDEGTLVTVVLGDVG